MYIYAKDKKEKNITADDVTKIENYISKIYMWQELTGEALPKFSSTNDANEKWIWEVVKKNLDDYDKIAYEQIQDKAKEIFGNDFTKQFPKEGNESFVYDEQQQAYQATNVELDCNMDAFLLSQISKNKNIYEVKIIEYIEDYSEESNINPIEETDYTIHIKNLEGQEIASAKNSEGKDKIIEQVKANEDKFTSKTISIKVEQDKLLKAERNAQNEFIGKMLYLPTSLSSK